MDTLVEPGLVPKVCINPYADGHLNRFGDTVHTGEATTALTLAGRAAGDPALTASNSALAHWRLSQMIMGKLDDWS